MTIIATVGRRSFGVSTLIGTMYLVLTLGGISMVYPFLLMLSTATTTENDMQEYKLIPAYYHDDNALYRKYLWLRYDTGLAGIGARDYKKAYPGSDVSRFRNDEYFGWGDGQKRGQALPPNIPPDDPGVRQRAADLDRFLRESASLWPGEPLTETVVDETTGRKVRRPVLDPFGRPVDPGGLTTGLGNMYRTVGYIGTVYTGLSGPGRDEWPKFLERFYTDPSNPAEPEGERLKRVIERHGRPYQRLRQACPGYDMPSSPSWSIIDGEYVQSDWLYYKAVWLTGAPVEEDAGTPGRRDAGTEGDAGTPGRRDAGTKGETPSSFVRESPRLLPTGISESAGKLLGLPTEPYTDVLGRSCTWAEPKSLRSVRPTLIAEEFAWDLKARYGTVDQFNLAMGLARADWAESPQAGAAKKKAIATGREVVLAKTMDGSSLGGPATMPESRLVALVRALAGKDHPGKTKTPPTRSAKECGAYLLPPQISTEWAKITGAVGLNADAISRLNDWLDDRWVELFKSPSAGYQTAHLAPFGQEDFTDVYLSSRRPIYEPLAGDWDQFVSLKVPRAMIQSLAFSPGGETGQPGENASGRPTSAGFVFDAAHQHLRLPTHAWRDFLYFLYGGDDAPMWKDKSPAERSARQAEFRALYLAGLSAEDVDQRVRAGRMLYGPEYDQFSLARFPIADRDVVEFHTHKGELRRHFMFGNFQAVLDELVLQGRAMFNTIVLVLLAIACNITVNPLAAYALSRFRLAYTYKVLLFMLATMAFPPAVAMIPSFLLLKNLGLINTYAALVLPGIASGYTIFLLKGFFDALPQELYEAAEIDGAGKITTFLNVTYPLSKPIFAIITLGAFTAAYSGFMWAFLICPDQKMWTIMVHLFNIQQDNPTQAGIAMAALVIAALPTFLVFLFCQNVILRGIIVPSFK